MGRWTGHDADVIASRYADECEFRSHPFREAVHGREGARQYALQAFAEERSVTDTEADEMEEHLRGLGYLE
jgi:hypothetical protein